MSSQLGLTLCRQRPRSQPPNWTNTHKTHSLTYSIPLLTPSLTHSLTHWLTHSLTCSVPLLTPSLTHSLTHSLITIHSPVHAHTYTHTHKLTHHHPSITLILLLPFLLFCAQSKSREVGSWYHVGLSGPIIVGWVIFPTGWTSDESLDQCFQETHRFFPWSIFLLYNRSGKQIRDLRAQIRGAKT